MTFALPCMPLRIHEYLLELFPGVFYSSEKEFSLRVNLYSRQCCVG